MLIDWVSAYVDCERIAPEVWAVLETLNDRIQRICTRTGEIKYTTAAWDSIRSDSHQLAVQVTGSVLRMQGSPARVIADGDTVFSAGASRALDLRACVEIMARHVAQVAGVDLGILPEAWRVTRVDVTGNLLLGDLAEVRQALAVLRSCEGGRYRVSQVAGDTVYWGGRSPHKRGKAYAKGPHLRYLMRQKTYTGRQYSASELIAADRLLRLELTLGRKFWKQQAGGWLDFTGMQLAKAWDAYFGKMVGDAEMKTGDDLKARCIAVAPTEGQGRAAYGLWLLIAAEGWEAARDATAPRTWYRNLKILRDAGLGDADLSMGQVVVLRRRVLDAQLVEDWADLRAA